MFEPSWKDLETDPVEVRDFDRAAAGHRKGLGAGCAGPAIPWPAGRSETGETHGFKKPVMLQWCWKFFEVSTWIFEKKKQQETGHKYNHSKRRWFVWILLRSSSDHQVIYDLIGAAAQGAISSSYSDTESHLSALEVEVAELARQLRDLTLMNGLNFEALNFVWILKFWMNWGETPKPGVGDWRRVRIPTFLSLFSEEHCKHLEAFHIFSLCQITNYQKIIQNLWVLLRFTMFSKLARSRPWHNPPALRRFREMGQVWDGLKSVGPTSQYTFWIFLEHVFWEAQGWQTCRTGSFGTIIYVHHFSGTLVWCFEWIMDHPTSTRFLSPFLWPVRRWARRLRSSESCGAEDPQHRAWRQRYNAQWEVYCHWYLGQNVLQLYIFN